MPTTTISISGLSPLDRKELSEAGAEGEVTFETNETEAGRPGAEYEPMTITAVIILGSMGIKALAAWLTQKRNRKHVSITIRSTDAQGNSHEELFEYDFTESSTDADVIDAIGKQFGIDKNTIELAKAAS